MNLKEWTDSVHETAKEKGWWDRPRQPLEIHMLMVSELAEATEEARNGTPPLYYVDEKGNKISTSMNFHAWEFPPNTKPEGEMIELADVVIRILDYFGHKGWDLEQAMILKHHYNHTRPYRHGGKLA